MAINLISLYSIGLTSLLAAQSKTGANKEAAGSAPAAPDQPAEPGAVEELVCQSDSCQALPQTARQFIDYAAGRISQTNDSIRELERQRTEARKRLYHPNAGVRALAASLVADLDGQIAELKLTVWLSNLDRGTPQSTATLLSNLSTASSGTGGNRIIYWRAQIAMILASELENPQVLSALASIIGNDTHWEEATDPAVREQLALIQIHDQLLTHQAGPSRGQEINELSLLIGENFFRRAMIAKDQASPSQGAPDEETFSSLLARARTFVAHLATASVNAETGSQAALLGGHRATYIRNSIEGLQENGDYVYLRREIAWANLLMANILVQEAENAGSLEQRLDILQNQALPYLRNTTPLRGMPQLEARRVEADVWSQIGYLQHDLGRDPGASFGSALCLQNEVIAWADDYHSELGTGTPQRWLVKIETSARISRAKLIMVLIGDLDVQTPPATLCLLADDLQPQDLQVLQHGASETRVLEIQRRLLERQAQALTAALDLNYSYADVSVRILNPLEQADVKLALAENLARQAFIARNL
ncbi:MAG: hypothetical protein PHT59_06305 [Candidatus Omnitrophica bacterium]|nr:hypothetical protein [Candidatus Omnitrophota bacterium]